MFVRPRVFDLPCSVIQNSNSHCRFWLNQYDQTFLSFLYQLMSLVAILFFCRIKAHSMLAEGPTKRLYRNMLLSKSLATLIVVLSHQIFTISQLSVVLNIALAALLIAFSTFSRSYRMNLIEKELGSNAHLASGQTTPLLREAPPA